ncbi:hypothetical protein ABGB07_43970 [Micromonosporaceae bacterium B7E4]
MLTNDLRDDEDYRVVVAAKAFRQAREGKEFDCWEMLPCNQDDVDRARALVEALDAVVRSNPEIFPFEIVPKSKEQP